MNHYIAYNLSIDSDILFPELITVKSYKNFDITIRINCLSNVKLDGDNNPDSFLGQIEGAGLFLVRNGNEIVIDPEPGIEESLIRPLILGPMMSILLRQRGMLVLHGSCVALNGSAIAFIGDSGWGKSTLADFFHAKGYSLLTDDVMALQMNEDLPIVVPSFPQIKLWSDAAEAIGHDPTKLSLLHPKSPKFGHQLINGFIQQPVPLKRLYVLGIGTHHKIVSLEPQQAFVDLVRHSRAMKLLQNSRFLLNHIHHCTKLIQNIPISLLNRRKSLAAIPELIELIEEDIEKLSLNRQQEALYSV